MATDHPPVPRTGPVGPLWVRLRRAAAADATGELVSGSALVLAPHPDDETIACGLLIAARVARGERVTVVVATDGGLGWFGDGPAPAPDELATVRSAEWHAALDTLGVPADDRIELGYPDGDLSGYEDAAGAAIAGLIADRAVSRVFCPTPDDLHVDHRALARAALRAVASRASGGTAPDIYGYRVYPEAGLWPPGRTEAPRQATAVVRLVRSLPGLVRHPDLALHAPELVALKVRAAAAHVSQRRILDGPAGSAIASGVELFRRLDPGDVRGPAGRGGPPDGLSAP